MIPWMALTPGGGRAPSTQPPPTPPSEGQPRPARDRRTPPVPRAATYSAVRWGVLIGGLVIIADLGAQAMSQRTLSPDDRMAIAAADEVVNWLLFSILGIIVARETRLIYMGAVAGIFASLLDAIVVASAASMARPIGPEIPVEEYFLYNLMVGTVFAGLSCVVYLLVQRWSGRR
jgi:hypothetical protein